MALEINDAEEFKYYTNIRGIVKDNPLNDDEFNPSYKFTDNLPQEEGVRVYHLIAFVDVTTNDNVLYEGYADNLYNEVTQPDTYYSIVNGFGNGGRNAWLFSDELKSDLKLTYPKLFLVYAGLDDDAVGRRENGILDDETYNLDGVDIQRLKDTYLGAKQVELGEVSHAEGSKSCVVPHFKKVPVNLVNVNYECDKKIKFALDFPYSVPPYLDNIGLRTVHRIGFRLTTKTKIIHFQQNCTHFDVFTNDTIYTTVSFSDDEWEILNSDDLLTIELFDFYYSMREVEIYYADENNVTIYDALAPNGNENRTYYNDYRDTVDIVIDATKLSKCTTEEPVYDYDGVILNVYDITDAFDNPIQDMFYYVNYLSYRYSPVAIQYLQQQYDNRSNVEEDKNYILKWYASILPRIEDINYRQLILLQNALSAGIKYYVSRTHQSMPENQQAYNISFQEYEKALIDLKNDTNDNGIIYIEKRHFKDL